MKSITLLFTLLALAFAFTASAADLKQVVAFSQYSSASGSAVYSSAINVINYRHKTVQVNGYDMTTKASAALSGTALVQCGPTESGPWVTCAQEDSTAISATSNSVLQWSDVTHFIRVSWAKTAGRVSVWLNASTN